MTKLALSSQFWLFLAAGGTAALINFGSRIIYNTWFGYSTAIIAAYLTGMIVAFVLSKIFVFKNTTRTLHVSGLIFIFVNLMAAAQTWAISIGLAYYLLPYLGITKFSHEIAHAAGIAFPVISSYWGHKHFSFANNTAQNTD